MTILLPNYKTLTLTKLCLRLIRKYTPPDEIKVIVIDNDSHDESLDYLRSLTWIDLIERKALLLESPVQAHARALDLGLANVETPYVLSIHTDTLIKHPQWLDFLIDQFKINPLIAGVGSWKLEAKPWWRRSLKSFEYYCQRGLYALLDRKNHGLEGVGSNFYYLRSHCAMYRMDVIRQLNVKFSDGDAVAGKMLHKACIEAGYQMVFLPSDKLISYVEHINHATSVLNPELSSRQKSVIKGLSRIKMSLAKIHADEILQDITLDV